MLVSLYLLSVLYTNSMGLIIINKCKPFIDKEIESKGYSKKELSDSELLSKMVKDTILFFIPGYYLKKAIDLTSNERDLDRIIKNNEKNGEFVKTSEDEVSEDIPQVDSIFKKVPKHNYENVTTYRAIHNNEQSMYTDMRYPNSDEVDMEFWEEEEADLKPYLEPEEKEEAQEIRKEPMQEYLDSFSDEELVNMVKQLETIRRLKKESEKILNNKVA